MRQLVFSTRNRHKLEEIQSIVPESLTLLTLDDIGYEDDIPEPYDTLEENAVHKANTIFQKNRIAVFAEDSGLFVDVLGGRPGVFSARYAGEKASAKDNISLLLNEMFQAENRNAYFKTIISYLDEEGNHYLFEGICAGHISEEEMGEGGFGYDPVFIPAGESRSFAQMGASEKNAISHRKKAMDQLLHFLMEEEKRLEDKRGGHHEG